MRYEIFDGEYVGAAEWVAPGEVVLDVQESALREWLERYFAAEESVMTPLGSEDGMTCERRDASEAAFNRAVFQLAGYSYQVRRSDPEPATVQSRVRSETSARSHVRTRRR
jgi:hypothetical protein